MPLLHQLCVVLLASRNFAFFQSEKHYPIMFIGLTGGLDDSSITSLNDHPIILSSKTQNFKWFGLYLLSEFFEELCPLFASNKIGRVASNFFFDSKSFYRFMPQSLGVRGVNLWGKKVESKLKRKNRKRNKSVRIEVH